MNEMQFDREKLKEVILYLCSKCAPSELGAVKLNKALYYGDMVHYAETGSAITAATYKKRPLGPTCHELLPTLRMLEAEGSLSVETVEYFGYRKRQYKLVKPFHATRLSELELALLDDVTEFVCRNNTAKTISDFSHSRPWEQVEFDAVIPYHSALLLFPNQVSPEAFDWASGEVTAVEAARSNEDPLDYSDFSAFRERVLQKGFQ